MRRRTWNLSFSWVSGKWSPILARRYRPHRLTCTFAGLGATFLWAAAPSSRCDGEMAPEPLGPSWNPNKYPSCEVLRSPHTDKSLPLWGEITGSRGDLCRRLGNREERGYTEEAIFKSGLKRRVIACQAVKVGRNFREMGLEAQTVVKRFCAFREG